MNSNAHTRTHTETDRDTQRQTETHRDRQRHTETGHGKVARCVLNFHRDIKLDESHCNKNGLADQSHQGDGFIPLCGLLPKAGSLGGSGYNSLHVEQVQHVGLLTSRGTVGRKRVKLGIAQSKKKEHVKSLGKARLKQTRTMKQFLEYSKGNNATLPVFIVANYFLAANKMCLVLSPTDNPYPYFHYLQH